MDILIKRYLKTPTGTVPDGETRYSKSSFQIGASSDQDIVIEWPGVALRHAVLEQAQSGQWQLKSKSLNGVLISDKVISQAELKAGSQFQIGNTVFEIGSDDNISITTDETLAPPSLPKYQTRLSQTGFSKRRWSWGLIGAICLLFLLGPLLTQLVRHSPVTTIIPSDGSWNTGSFHPAHQYFADDCSQCHQTPFLQTPNSACVECHQETAAHAPAKEFPQAELQTTQCQDCHKEHNGAEQLVSADPQMCVTCHSDISDFTEGKSKQTEIDDWWHSHPEISLKMARWDSQMDSWQWSQQAADKVNTESSGLIFPHDVHLQAEGVSNGRDKQIMQCNDCHQAEPGGKLMQPISMEQHCASCHRLDFDIDEPELEVRHGTVATALRDIAGLKDLNTLDRELGVKAKPAPQRPTLFKPGKQSQNYAAEKATLKDLASELIEKRGCASCHSVQRNEAALNEMDLVNGWQIEPVHINQRWIDLAEFDHSGHTSMSCGECHSQAENSATATDVLMPDRAVCMSCHGDPGNDELTDSECIDCHSYHLPKHGWLERPAQGEGEPHD